MSTSNSNRSFSAPPSIHNVALGYVWDPNAVVSTRTGNWVALTAPGGVTPVTGTMTPNTTVVTPVSGVITPIAATYTSTISQIYGTGQVIIPTTAKRWSVQVITGTAYVNAVAIMPGITLNGGGFDGRLTMASTLAVGVTGTDTFIPHVLVQYDA